AHPGHPELPRTDGGPAEGYVATTGGLAVDRLRHLLRLQPEAFAYRPRRYRSSHGLIAHSTRLEAASSRAPLPRLSTMTIDLLTVPAARRKAIEDFVPELVP